MRFKYVGVERKSFFSNKMCLYLTEAIIEMWTAITVVKMDSVIEILPYIGSVACLKFFVWED